LVWGERARSRVDDERGGRARGAVGGVVGVMVGWLGRIALLVRAGRRGAHRVGLRGTRAAPFAGQCAAGSGTRTLGRGLRV
jgi:hypothetical protein